MQFKKIISFLALAILFNLGSLSSSNACSGSTVNGAPVCADIKSETKDEVIFTNPTSEDFLENPTTVENLSPTIDLGKEYE